MTQATTHPQTLTFEEYLSYDDGTDIRYELVDGELVALPPESGINAIIATYLVLMFARVVDFRLIHSHCCELQVSGKVQNRYPDLIILQPEHLQLTQKRLTITLDMPPPPVIVEIVSPGEANRQRDYLEKRQQYAARGIPEYWIVDPQAQMVMILRLEASNYVEVGQFRQQEQIVSPMFPTLTLTAAQILQAE